MSLKHNNLQRRTVHYSITMCPNDKLLQKNCYKRWQGCRPDIGITIPRSIMFKVNDWSLINESILVSKSVSFQSKLASLNIVPFKSSFARTQPRGMKTLQYDQCWYRLSLVRLQSCYTTAQALPILTCKSFKQEFHTCSKLNLFQKIV